MWVYLMAEERGSLKVVLMAGMMVVGKAAWMDYC